MERLNKIHLIIFLILILLCLCMGCNDTQDELNISEMEIELPWEDGGKLPEEYSWDEFNSLSGPQQIKFQNAFDNTEAFEKWMLEAQGLNEETTWSIGDRDPKEFTWEEFIALSGAQQIIFQEAFENEDAFEDWMRSVQEAPEELPWDTGDKKPDEYSWEEFNALSGDLQIQFQNSFESEEAFEDWMHRVQGNSEDATWNGGDKLPNEYTWEEFLALTGEQQIEFQNSFESEDAFEDWMYRVQGILEDATWNSGDKLPNEYTWEEFLALSGEQQIQFQNSFESDEAFENWMIEAQNAE